MFRCGSWSLPTKGAVSSDIVDNRATTDALLALKYASTPIAPSAYRQYPEETPNLPRNFSVLFFPIQVCTGYVPGIRPIISPLYTPTVHFVPHDPGDPGIFQN